MMNKIVMMALCLFAFLSVKATGLDGDVIHIDGKYWGLLAKPINNNRLLYKRLMDFLPENRSMSTADWDGYTAFWKIEDGYLYLQHIEVTVYDKDRNRLTIAFLPDDLKQVFAFYYANGKIRADWFTGQIRAVHGEFVRYIHSGFNRNLETEQVIDVKEGQVLRMELYHNYKKDGLKMEYLFNELDRRFPWEEFPKYQTCKLYFTIQNYLLTADGRFVDCDIMIHVRPTREEIRDSAHPLVRAFKEIARSVYPLEVYFINGKFTLIHDKWTHPFSMERTEQIKHRFVSSKNI